MRYGFVNCSTCGREFHLRASYPTDPVERAGVPCYWCWTHRQLPAAPPEWDDPAVAVNLLRQALAVFRVMDVDPHALPDWCEPLPPLEGPYDPREGYPPGRAFTTTGIAGWVFRGAVRRLQGAVERMG